MGTTSGECMIALAAESATGNVSPCKGVVLQMHCCEVPRWSLRIRMHKLPRWRWPYSPEQSKHNVFY